MSGASAVRDLQRALKVCGGPLFLLGQLGDATWLRCQNCGAEETVS